MDAGSAGMAAAGGAEPGVQPILGAGPYERNQDRKGHRHLDMKVLEEQQPGPTELPMQRAVLA